MKNQDKFKETEIGRISEGWKTKELCEICDITMGQSPPSSTYNTKKFGLPFFQGRKDFGIKFPVKTMWCSEPKRSAKEGDVLLSVRAPVGDVNVAVEKCCIGRGLSSLSMKNENKEFLYYLIVFNQQRLKQIFESEGTVFGCVTKDGLKNFKVILPSEENEQQSISKILSDLDSKIELNQQMNKTLEAIGQAIFKHWFVDFEFPNNNGKPYKSSSGEMIDSELGQIPKGWRVKEITDCGNVICGKTPSTQDKSNYGSDVPFITIPDMHNQIFIVKTERKLSFKGAETQKKKELPPLSVCVSCIATPGIVVLTTEPSQTNQQINSIVCNRNISPYFVYFAMKNMSEEIKSMGLGGTATLNLNTRNFEKIKIIVPPDITMNKFHRTIEKLFQQILNNSKQIINLSQLRDSLLPKLMSGEIRVKI